MVDVLCGKVDINQAVSVVYYLQFAGSYGMYCSIGMIVMPLVLCGVDKFRAARLGIGTILCRILDGDNIRAGINSNLGFSAEDRKENIRRIAEIGKLFVDTGIVTIACFVSPTLELRQMAREIIGAEDFREVYIATPLEECERRDVKGLYARARKGEVKDFTGISAPFEAPTNPDLSLDTSQMTLKDEVEAVVKLCQRDN